MTRDSNDKGGTPVLHPALEEFSDMSAYLQSHIMVNVDKVAGLVKVIPPHGWVARPHGYDDKETLMRISGRQLSSGDEGAYTLSTEERGGIYLSDFKKIVENSDMGGSLASVEEEEIDFWSSMGENVGEIISAHSPNGTMFGSEVNPWNLGNADQVKGRPSSRSWPLLSHGATGLSVGMRHSARGWYREEHVGVSFCHFGDGRTIYAVASRDGDRFEALLSKMFPSQASDSEVWRTRACLLDPAVLRRHKIPCVRVVQRPGEFLVSFPGTYLCSFSHGCNCWESAAIPAAITSSATAARISSTNKDKNNSHVAMHNLAQLAAAADASVHLDVQPSARSRACKVEVRGASMPIQGSQLAGSPHMRSFDGDHDVDNMAGKGIRRKRKKRDEEGATGGRGIAGRSSKDLVSAEKNKNCHFCEHAPKRCSIFTCTDSVCDQMFCENCCKRHLGRPTNFTHQDDADACGWRCPICVRICCCTLNVCDKDHLHCKRYRRRIKLTNRKGGEGSSAPPSADRTWGGQRQRKQESRAEEEEEASASPELNVPQHQQKHSNNTAGAQPMMQRQQSGSGLGPFSGSAVMHHTPMSPCQDLGSLGGGVWSGNLGATGLMPLQAGAGNVMMPFQAFVRMQGLNQQIINAAQNQQILSAANNQTHIKSRVDALNPFLTPATPGQAATPGMTPGMTPGNIMTLGTPGLGGVAGSPSAFGLGVATPLTPLGEVLGGVATPFSVTDGEGGDEQPARCSWFDHLFGVGVRGEGHAVAAAVMQSQVVEHLQAQSLLPAAMSANVSAQAQQMMLQQWAVQQHHHNQLQANNANQQRLIQQHQQAQKAGQSQNGHHGTLEDTTSSWAPDEFVFSEEEEDEAH